MAKKFIMLNLKAAFILSLVAAPLSLSAANIDHEDEVKHNHAVPPVSVAHEDLGVMRQTAMATLNKPDISQHEKEEALEALLQAAIGENGGYNSALPDFWGLLLKGKIEKTKAISWLERLVSSELSAEQQSRASEIKLILNNPDHVSNKIRAMNILGETYYDLYCEESPRAKGKAIDALPESANIKKSFYWHTKAATAGFRKSCRDLYEIYVHIGKMDEAQKWFDEDMRRRELHRNAQQD